MNRSLKSVLLASAAAATLAVPALAESHFFRTKPLVEAPRSFSFAPRSGIEPGAVAESATVAVRGYRGKTATVSGGEYQICSAPDCAGATWTTAPTSDLPPEFHARVRTVGPAFGQVATATLTVGGASAAFEAGSRAKDTTPDTITFASRVDVEPNQHAFSLPVTLSGFDGAPLSVSGGGYQVCTSADCSDRNGQPVLTAAMTEVKAGARIRLAATPGGFGDTATATLTVGGTTGTFSAKARARDLVPATVTFASTTAQAAASVTSATARLVDHDGVTATVSGATAELRVCSNDSCSGGTVGQWTTSATVARDEYVQLRMTADGAGLKRMASLSYGAAQAATWEVTSESAGLYAFTSHTFTTCGRSGRSGPTLGACRSVYSAAWAQSDSYLTVPDQGYQAWKVPATGTYSISASGAQGGSGFGASVRGRGRIVTARFNLTAGDTLLIAVGQPGTDGTQTQGAGGGGGGGTFVAIGSSKSTATPLIVAAGGGGTNAIQYGQATNIDSLGIDGRFANTGDVSRSTANANYLGNGASFSQEGRGYQSNALSFRTGLVGSYSGPYNNPGGFGGGGGPYYHNGGGGGGYTGGAGGLDHQYRGEGGGSYVAPSGSSAMDGGLNAGAAGSVTITKL